MNQRGIEVLVGLFVLFSVVALLILALRVSGLTNINRSNSYQVVAEFDNVGGLKIGAPVSVSGVKVGEVKDISLDPQTFRAQAILEIFSKQTKLPQDTAASIYTAGILGAQYVSLIPGFAEQDLQDQGLIETTHSAVMLENLIGQLMFNVSKGISK